MSDTNPAVKPAPKTPCRPYDVACDPTGGTGAIPAPKEGNTADEQPAKVPCRPYDIFCGPTIGEGTIPRGKSIVTLFGEPVEFTNGIYRFISDKK